MARASFILALSCCALSATLALAGPPELGGADPHAKIMTALEVQKAFEQGREYLQRGDYRSAVEVLENRVHLIDGNRRYVEALRDAYLGYIAELKKANRMADVARYQERLEVIDPGARLVRNSVAATSTPVATVPPVNLDKTSSIATNPAPAPQSAVTPMAPAVVVAVAPAAPTEKTTARAQSSEVIVARGKADDVFSDKNSLENHQARALVEKGTQAFLATRYDEAALLFAQAHRLCPAECASIGAQWGYCRLFAVQQALDKLDPKTPAPKQLEQEVRVAVSLAPKLEGEGNNLLKRIQGQPGSAIRKNEASSVVAVRHTPRKQGQNYSLAETTNFRIFHNQKPEFAERVAQVVEEARTKASVKWFGDDGGTWTPRCDIYLHATGQDYAEATHTPASSPGHSSINRAQNSDKIVSRGIDVHCDNPNMLLCVLPHETTHVVLAGRFGANDIPRWADEGMAVLSEPRERIDRHLKNLSGFAQQQQLFSTGPLLQLPDYPEGRYVGVFYAQSVSIVEFLSTRKGAVVFSRFLREGMESGYEPALRKYYGLSGFKELDLAWRQATFGETATVAAR